MPPIGADNAADVLSAGMGQWAVAASPTRIRALLGSCVGVVLIDARGKVGGVAHVVLPESRGESGQPGKYADTAIPGMIADLERLLGRGPIAGRLAAKVVGGASMFQAEGSMNIGRMNGEAVARILEALRIPILASDLGGEAGRRLVLDTATGAVAIRIPGGADYTI
ncbi:MAG TPA: chemotaxis protein CheD [Isosphaeraceae bacterium]|nr:chemotaxis protein CheD [Isosphaeraceae bacterium]